MNDRSVDRHLLLIGNQGTGKNKLVDHLLSLLKWEREYMQLHRDTTVGALTVQPTLEAGRVSWEDRAGHRASRRRRRRSSGSRICEFFVAD